MVCENRERDDGTAYKGRVSDRFSGCGIKPRGSGAGEIVPAGRDRGRRDKAHSNSRVDTH